jgi:hypothetical protein
MGKRQFNIDLKHRWSLKEKKIREEGKKEGKERQNEKNPYGNSPLKKVVSTTCLSSSNKLYFF